MARLSVSVLPFAQGQDAQGEVVEIGRATVSPRHDVVALGPFWWLAAVGEAAALVAGDQGDGLGAGRYPLRAAFGQYRAAGVADQQGKCGLISQS